MEADRDPLLEAADALTDPTAAYEAPPAPPEPAPIPAPIPAPEPTPALRTVDPGALLIGLWFLVAGILGATLGEGALDDLPPVVVPISFAVVGLGLLLPKRQLPR